MTAENWVAIIVAIIGTNVIEKLFERLFDKKGLLVAMAHDRIVCLGSMYIKRGYITKDEYTNIMNIFTPYKKRGGNCLADKIIAQVKELPLKEGGIEV